MRYEKGRKEATRRRIVDVAARRFRDEGISAVGVATLMADAGLTHGGFYAHFDSKEELVREAIASAAERSALALGHAGAEGGLEAIIRRYLSSQHRDRPGEGCALAPLAGEIARHPQPTRATLATGIEQMIDVLAPHVVAGDAAGRRAKAGAIVALLVGTLELARVEPDEERSKQRLEAGIAAALQLAG